MLRQRFHLVAHRAQDIVLAEDAARIARTITTPDDHDVTAAIHGHGRRSLVARSRRIDLELAPLGDACRIVLPGVDGPAATVLPITRPGDREAAVAVHAHRRIYLVVECGGVDAELAPL